MITAALEFLHARKWLVELLLLAAVVIGVYLFCQHLIGVGVQKERAVWVAKMAEQQRENDIESAKKQGRADAAHEADQKEIARLNQSAHDDPLHGGLCGKPSRSAVSATTSANGHHESASATGGDIRALPAGNSQPGGQSDPDVRHLLDVLEFHADGTSAELRECQAR